MEIWFSDFSTPNIKLDIRVTRQLFSGLPMVTGAPSSSSPPVT